MDDKNKCKITECCQKHWYRMLGIILVVLAAILTVITFSGLGILGMFLAGLMLCCHKHLSSGMGWGGCGCGCSCCSSSNDMKCNVTEKVEKKTSSKKSST